MTSTTSSYLKPTGSADSGKGRLTGLADIGLAALICGAATGGFFKFGLASYVWAVIYAGLLIVLARDREQILGALTRAWPVLVFPLVCFVSVVWSTDPGHSLRNSVQYLATAAMGLWLGSVIRPPAIFRVLCAVLVTCVVVSVAATYLGLIGGIKEDDYVGAERYFIGIYTQKNIMGNTLVIAALATLVTGMTLKRPLLALAAALCLFPVLWATRSTTSLLLYGMALTYPVTLWFLTSVRHRAPVLLSLLLLALLAWFALLAADVNILQMGLEALGKDATLTGRTVIWRTGTEVFSSHPLTGVGYQAFWESQAFETEVMTIRAAVLETIGGFHSGYLEALVAAGLGGLLTYIAMVLYGLLVNARSAVATPTALSVGCMYMTLHILARTFTESALYYQHDLEFILLVALTVAAGRAGDGDLRK